MTNKQYEITNQTLLMELDQNQEFLLYVDFFFMVNIDNEILIVEDIEIQIMRVFNKFKLLGSIEIELEDY